MSDRFAILGLIIVVVLVLNIIFSIRFRTQKAPVAGILHIDESDITDVKMKMDCDLDIDDLAKFKEIRFRVNYIPPSQNKQFTYRED